MTHTHEPRPAAALLLLLLLLPAAGCPAKARSTRPQEVLAAYSEAVKAGRFERAYALMSEEYRKEHSKAEFLELMTSKGRQVRDAAARLGARPTRVRVEASLTYGSSEEMKLVREEGGWRIASDPVDFYSQRTPKEALRSFIRAIENRRYDVVMRFVPARWADSMTVDKLREQWEGPKKKEVGKLLQTLKANLNAPINRSGNRATMPYGDKYEVRFLREDGRWKIEDPD